ncbi:N-hydroxyarylamine O-acetyltransferase [Paenibacillus sp. UNC496MF]|uniref:arylamine N-acetyltransferase family protein n=1 Tax=Paenibacillus sp. UNC496MF TaxID=1502753 RepID=UPI0008EEF8C9|nr:arylamine N-acetyltransferase [Paenibacillus sp. UNC496MF]SFJ15657.1 N-hydroxyarylamine O-acetyltransferase [Paenibacillus sp. UNC496MF]
MPNREIHPQVEAYLKRIRYEGPLDGSAEALAGLQRAHLMAVPYENLDILNGVPLSLDPEALWDKIVRRRRGGYCFELNALFGWLLRELGYPVTDYVARFWRDETALPPKRRHHVLKVEAEGAFYLCDVGVGGAVPRRPLLLQDGLEQEQGAECYRLDRDASFGWFLSERKRGEWGRVYSFTEEPQLKDDYAFASFWCQHAPESPFRAGALLAICTPEGRNTGAGEEIRLFRGGEVTVLTPPTKAEYAAALKTYFGIDIPEAEAPQGKE